MYSRQESAILKERFWTSFGKYMQPVPSVAGVKVNWINYKTGIKDIRFTMDAGNREARISILFSHIDFSERQRMYGIFLGLKNQLHAILEEDWQWASDLEAEGKKYSAIFTQKKGINIFREEQWPDLIFS